MSLIVYLDETGDHTLTAIDRDFPIFGLAMIICEESSYAHTIASRLTAFKLKWFGHDGIILHSYEIRKSKNAFKFLFDADKRKLFMAELTELMESLPYRIIASAVLKQAHVEQYGVDAHSPYDIALTYCLEELTELLEATEQESVRIVAESRGRNENTELEASFYHTISTGTSRVSADRFKRRRFTLSFVSKSHNLPGHQISDLAAYPIARHVLHPEKPNLSFDVLRGKIHVVEDGEPRLGVFPKK
jgi:hypothetical protein